MTPSSTLQPGTSHGEGPRRNFLVEALATLIGGAITLVPVALGGLFFIHPLRKKGGSAAAAPEDGFLKVGTTGGLSAGGPPQLFQVTGVKQDAWTTYPQTELGAVYVRLESSEGDEPRASCFNARCPHLGCTVNYQADKEQYLCPCHDSSFTLDGERNNEIPPRGMDPLEVEIRNGNEVWVKFQNFRAGQEARTPIV